MKRSVIFLIMFGLSGLSIAETFHGSFEVDARKGSRKANITGDVSVTGGQGN